MKKTQEKIHQVRRLLEGTNVSFEKKVMILSVITELQAEIAEYSTHLLEDTVRLAERAITNLEQTKNG